MKTRVFLQFFVRAWSESINSANQLSGFYTMGGLAAYELMIVQEFESLFKKFQSCTESTVFF